MTGGGAMQFVPPLFFSRPGKGEGGRRRCFSRVYGRGGLAGCRQGGEWKKMCGCGKKNRERVCRYSQKYYLCTAIATIAQSVEHFIRNEKVPGSSPGRGSKRGSMQIESLFLFVSPCDVEECLCHFVPNAWLNIECRGIIPHLMRDPVVRLLLLWHFFCR